MSGMSYHPYAITKRGTVNQRIKVPESCIESCETILRWAANPNYRFTQGGLGSGPGAPAMYLLLKRGDAVVVVNVSDNTSDETFDACAGLTSFLGEDVPLNTALAMGQGVSFMNVGPANEDGYNMHFLAALILAPDGVTLSDVSEPDHWNELSKTVIGTVKAATIAALRAELGEPYTDTTNYAAALVTLSP